MLRHSKYQTFSRFTIHCSADTSVASGQGRSKGRAGRDNIVTVLYDNEIDRELSWDARAAPRHHGRYGP